MTHKLNKPISFKIQKSPSHALLVQVDEAPYFYDQLHYHPEIQLTAIIRGSGVLYAGNNMTNFTEGEIFIIGANVPHLLKNTKTFNQNEMPTVKGISLFFDNYSFGKQFFELKELHKLKTLLQESNRVIKLTEKNKGEIYQKILKTPEYQDEQLIITFLEILRLFVHSEKEFLNPKQHSLILNENEGGRLNEVLNYTFKNMHAEITIEQIAKIAYLSRSQFSYFFKLHTGNTYIQFLTQLRIEKACLLLRSTNRTIEQICYEVGFKNVSNFVRHFKKIKNQTPSNYRKEW